MFLTKLFTRSSPGAGAHALYGAAVARAREVVFYRDFAVPDTFEGRFEMISFHVFLVLRRLKDGAEDGVEMAPGIGNDLGQTLFDLMFADMDRNLREMGAGDLGVGRRVKTMASAFCGRIKAYDAGLLEGDAALSMAIARNVFNQTGPGPGPCSEAAMVLAHYMAECVRNLKAQPDQMLAQGDVAFAPLPVMASAP